MTLTLLTALLDLGRGTINGPFRRGIGYYTDSLRKLMQLPFPKVIYLDRSIDGFEGDANTRIVRIDADDLQRFPWYHQVQAIRSDPRWYKQIGWLKDSPQCRLAGYNPLVMSKMIWLNDLARENPFGTDGVFWLDAGIFNNRRFGYFGDVDFINRTIQQPFSYVTRPCHDRREVHGFKRAAFDRYCGRVFADSIVAGGVFGGNIASVRELHGYYMQAAKEAFAEGLMGTEENLLTIAAQRYERVHHHDPLKHRRRILVIGHPRSGTGYMARLLQAHGLDVGHEYMGSHGISSWLYVPDADPPFSDFRPRSRFDFDTVVHVVRNPLNVVASSIHTENRGISLDFRRHWTKPAADYNAYEEAVHIMLGWNELCAKQRPTHTVRVETADVGLPALLGLGQPVRKPPSKTTNTRPHPPLTWDELSPKVRLGVRTRLAAYALRCRYDLNSSASR